MFVESSDDGSSMFEETEDAHNRNLANFDDIEADADVNQNFETLASGLFLRCSKNCTMNCGLFVKEFSQEDLVSIKTCFKSQHIITTKNNLLKHLNAQCKLKMSIQNFNFKGHLFCVKAFSALTGISEYILKTVLDEFVEDKCLYVHGNQSAQRESLAVLKFESWLISYSELNGQYAPDECTIVLPDWLTKASLFNIYVEESSGPHVSKSSFYRLFKEKFGPRRKNKSLPHIRISKYSTHSICAQCLAIRQFQKSCKTVAEFEYSKNLQAKHREVYGNARRKICEIEQSALSYPEDHLLIKIDGMDNRKSDLPRFLTNSKQFANFQKLACHITGAIITSGHYPKKEKQFFFVNHNQFEQGSNMIVTIVYHLLLDFLLEFKRFPKKLHLNTDNCARENKNRFMFAFCDALVKLDIFHEVTMDFLIVGHTGR